MTRACPDCRYPMVTERHHDIELDVCRNCAGIWFDAEELRQLLAADPVSMVVLEEKLTPRVTQHKIKTAASLCPGCSGLLHIYHYQYDSPIELNACLDCGGFWVQEGELEKMQQWRHEHARPDAQEAQGLAVAHAAMEHNRAVARTEGMRRFFGLLQQHRPLWWSGQR